jgi:hypothetical protein
MLHRSHRTWRRVGSLLAATALAATVLLSTASTALAWGGVSHEGWSYTAARNRGISIAWATKIGQAAYDIDWTIGYDPFTAWRYHGDESGNTKSTSANTVTFLVQGNDTRYTASHAWSTAANNAWKAGRKDEAAKWLGYAMHAEQDIMAHGNIKYGSHFSNLDNVSWRSPWEIKMGYTGTWRAKYAQSLGDSVLGHFAYLGSMK